MTYDIELYYSLLCETVCNFKHQHAALSSHDLIACLSQWCFKKINTYFVLAS